MQNFDQMKNIADLAPCGIGLFDPETAAPVFLNKAYYDLVGYAKEEYEKLITDHHALMFPEDLSVSDKSSKEYGKVGKADGYEYRIVRKDGQVRWVKLNVSTIRLGEKSYAFTSFTDITREKEISSRLSLIAENVGSSLSLIRVTGGKEELIYGNDVFFKNVGLSKEEYQLKMRLLSHAFVSEEDYTRIMHAANEALKTGKTGDITYKFMKPDGRTLWLNRRFAAIAQDTPDTYLLVSVVTDVTEKTEAELEAALEQQRFQTVIDEMNAAVFEWNHKTNEFFKSPAYMNYAMSRISNEDILSNRGPLDTVHPDDVGELQKFFAETNTGNEKAESVLRLKMTDGSYRWCRMLGYYYKDEDGTPSRTIGVIIDINEERERSFMLNQLLNEMPGGVGIFTFSDKLECRYFNDGFAALSGRTRAEVEELLSSGSLLETIIAPTDYRAVIGAVKSCAKSGKQINLNYRYIQKNGSIRWVHLSAVKMREENGLPIYYCVFTAPSEETELYRGIVEDSAVGVYAADRKTRRTIYTNAAARDIIGVSRSVKNKGRVITEYLASVGKSALLSESDVASLSHETFTEFHFERDNSFIAVKAKALLWNGIDSYILYMMDETKEHERQIQLQELVNKVPTGIGIYDIDQGQAKLTYLNDAYYEQLGVKRENRRQYYGSNAMAAVYPEDREKMYSLIKKLMDGSEKESALHRVQNKDGQWVWLNLTASVVERKENHLRIYAAFSDCDEMVRAKQEIDKAREREQMLLSSIPGGIAIYRLKKNGRLAADFVSEGLSRMCGYSHEEFSSFIKEEAFAGTAEEDVQIVREAARQSLTDHKPFSINYHIHVKNKSDILIRTDARLMEDEPLGEDDVAVWYAVHTVVSDSSKIALKEQEHYRTVLGMLGVAYWEWSKQNGFYASNNYLNYALSQVPFENVRDREAMTGIVHPEDEGILKAYFKQDTDAAKTSTVTLRLHMTDGTYQWTEMNTFKELSPDGELLRLSGTLRNVNDEWIRQRNALEKALEEANNANAAKTAFLSRVSHDMRTPLNGILGLAGLIREKISDKKISEDLMQLEVSGQYLLNLINDTLDVGRIESGNLELHPSVCDGHAIFDSVTALATQPIALKHIHIKTQTSGLQYPMLYIDVGRVEQIMLNILGNAAKFTPEGGHVSCSMKNISFENGIITDEVTITDDGIGISADFLPHIFEPFSQEDSSKKNARQGTGLGMMITKQLIEMMGGKISIKSEKGKGTSVTFTLVMPVATEEQIAEWKASQNITVNDAVLSGKRVLLCEDHPLNAKIAIRLLAKKGIIVEHADNGKIGLAKFADSPVGYYAAVLMDIRMPVMDGLETTEEIRRLSRPDAAGVPIIAMTANALADDIRQAKEAGMNEHLSKPIQPEILYRVLSRYLSGKEQKTVQ